MILLVANSCAVVQFRDIFKWVPDFEVRTFEDCVPSFSPDRSSTRKALGLSLSEMQARNDYYDFLKGGLPLAFPEGLRALSIDPYSMEDEFKHLEVSSSVCEKVVNMLRQTGQNAVTIYDADEDA